MTLLLSEYKIYICVRGTLNNGASNSFMCHDIKQQLNLYETEFLTHDRNRSLSLHCYLIVESCVWLGTCNGSPGNT